MPTEPGLPLAATLAALPPEWPVDLLPAIQLARQQSEQTVVVLDDDPTGTQSVHGVPVLTRWSLPELQAELAASGGTRLFYILTNSRSLPLAHAQALNVEIGQNLTAATQRANRALAVVSRSDSTLRGHFPGETEALMAALGGHFSATLLVPAFLAGGRYTLGDVHYVAQNGRLIPAGETEFARDPVFGYASSNLREWVVERSAGCLPLEAVASVSLEELRRGGPEAVCARLLSLPPASVCVVNAASERDLEVLALAALQAEAGGRRFLYRTAASFVRVRAGLAERPLLLASELGLPNTGGGLIVAGSHVPTTTAQLAALRATGITSVEVNVGALLTDGAQSAEIERAAHAVERALSVGASVLLFTSRALVTGSEARTNLDIGRRVSDGLVEIVGQLATRPRYVLAKGGITSSDLATRALSVRRALVLGQIRPGVPVWRVGPESRWPGLAYIVFPGNVGDATALAGVVHDLSAGIGTLLD